MATPQERREVRDRFLDAVSRQVDPPMLALGFTRNIGGIGQARDGEVGALYEYGPDEFARRFPKLADEFGTSVAPCIDIWVTLDTQTAELERHLGDLFGLDEWLRDEGSSALADLIWDTDAEFDARMGALAEAFAAYFDQ